MMYRIFDAHCHIYPEAIARKAVEGIDRFYDHLPFAPYDGTTETLLRIGRMLKPHRWRVMIGLFLETVLILAGLVSPFVTREIVNTVIVRDIKELLILAIVIALRAVLAILIHWEIKSERRDEQEKEAVKHAHDDSDKPADTNKTV